MKPTYLLLTLTISLILISVFTFLPFPIQAADTGLVTCGLMSGSVGPCTICDLVTLFQTLVNKANAYFALPLAALMLGYGGFLMVLSGFQGGNASLYKKGTTVLTNAVIGILIIFCSWIAIDTLLKTIGAYQHAVTVSPLSKFGPWHVIECVSPVVKWPKHFACNADKCEEVDGYAPAGCTMGSARNNCGSAAEHLGCQDSTCKWIKGTGRNDCTEGDDPKCSHKGCDGTSCKYIPGPGPNECDIIGDNDPKCTHGRTTDTERNLASALELDGLITFTNTNPDCDGKSADTNFREMANSQPLTVCHATCKTDQLPCTKKGSAKPEMMENLVTLAKQDVKFEVTSIATGQHSQGSDHYKGKGVDLSTAQNNYVNLETRFNELKKKGSPIRYIQCEKKGVEVGCNSGSVDHIHVSYN